MSPSAKLHSLELVKRQSLVLNALAREENPASADTLLDHLRAEGLRAPQQVYRALDKHRWPSTRSLWTNRNCQEPPTSPRLNILRITPERAVGVR